MTVPVIASQGTVATLADTHLQCCGFVWLQVIDAAPVLAGSIRRRADTGEYLYSLNNAGVPFTVYDMPHACPEAFVPPVGHAAAGAGVTLLASALDCSLLAARMPRTLEAMAAMGAAPISVRVTHIGHSGRHAGCGGCGPLCTGGACRACTALAISSTHLLADATTLRIIIELWAATYSALAAGEPAPPLAALPVGRQVLEAPLAARAAAEVAAGGRPPRLQGLTPISDVPPGKIEEAMGEMQRAPAKPDTRRLCVHVPERRLAELKAEATRQLAAAAATEGVVLPVDPEGKPVTWVSTRDALVARLHSLLAAAPGRNPAGGMTVPCELRRRMGLSPRALGNILFPVTVQRPAALRQPGMQGLEFGLLAAAQRAAVLGAAEAAYNAVGGALARGGPASDYLLIPDLECPDVALTSSWEFDHAAMAFGAVCGAGGPPNLPVWGVPLTGLPRGFHDDVAVLLPASGLAGGPGAAAAPGHSGGLYLHIHVGQGNAQAVAAALTSI